MTSIKEVQHLLHILLVLALFLLCFKTGSTGAGDSNTVAVKCIDRERAALLLFKQGLVDEFNRLSSWGSEEDKRDCCQWSGVYCNNYTGHVTRLDLSSYYYYYELPHIAGKNISPSLLELRNLNYLDLSGNDFGGMPIPKFIGSLSKLVHLDLSLANFGGTIPYQLGNLSNLDYLDLGSNQFESNLFPKFVGSLSKLAHLDLSLANFGGVIPHELGNLSSLHHLDLSSGSDQMYVNGLEWLSRLSSLTYLDLSWVNLSTASDWVGIINNLPFLSALYLFDCQLSQVVNPSLSFINSSTSISFRSLSKLKFLDLSYNNLTGPLLDLRGCRSLTNLDLSNNQFSGHLPNFRECLSLTNLDLSSNQFNGPLPDFREYQSLTSLDLSSDQPKAVLPKSFGSLSKLEFLDLSFNQLSGPLHDFIGYPSLNFLDLSSNQFNGPLPETIGQLSKLSHLDMSNNSLKGVISEGHLSNLSNLIVLDLSFTDMTYNLSLQWVPPFQLYALSLGSCKLGPRFPNWIQTQKKLSFVDLSNNGISDFVPTWFWDLSHGLLQLNLSSNNIRGILPNFTSIFFINPPEIDLSSNSFEGPIPRFLSKANSLNLSRNKFSGTLSFLQVTTGYLSFLDVSHNLLSGEIPDYWMHFERLTVLNLASNNFSGGIPSSFGFLFELESLILYNNSLSGKLPSSLRKCITLSFLDVGKNNLYGSIPAWIGENLSNLYVLRMRSNKFYGSIPLQLCHLTALRLLDLSINNISGGVPECFSNFTAMIQKESSSEIFVHSYNWYFVGSYIGRPTYTDNALVAMKGGEYDYGRNLRFIKSIDLSSNKLSGEFPRTITALIELVSFNVSNNDIYGNIPPQIGNLKSLESLDLSNNRISSGIPTSLSYLSFLSYLDLSNNNLSGKIPLGTQLQGFKSSMYSGNDELCGPPLLRKCRGDDQSSQDPSNSGGNEQYSRKGTYEFERGFCIGAALGFSTTFWGICGALLLNRHWRCAYFLYLKNLKDWIYVTVAMSITKFRRIF